MDCPECGANSEKVQGSKKFFRCQGSEEHYFEVVDGEAQESTTQSNPTIALG
jgi:ssDNA-binding Zn-finger/Zn-ribbon topoisomerase 1